MKHTALAAALSALMLAACGNEAPVNSPTELAQPVEAPLEAPASDGASSLPGTGPASFVGSWTADPSWCVAPQGERRPIEITATRFEGYENGCDIVTVEQVGEGYVAALRCLSEGITRNERVRMVVSAGTLDLTYLDRGGQSVALTKCTTLGDTPEPGAPSL